MSGYIRYLYGSLLVLCVVQAVSCSNSRYLTEKESLYLGSNVKIVDTVASKSDKKALKTELEASIRPKPNSSFLGIRLKLTLYNIAGVPKKEKGLRNWLRNKIGEPPVLGSDVNIDGNNKIMVNILQNYGYFRAESTGEKITKDKKTKVNFTVVTGPRTYIRDVNYQKSDTSQMGKDVVATQDKSLLKSGNPYSLQAIKDERIRIDNILKNKGYYYFSPEYMLIDADTGIGKNQADLTLKMKYSEIPANAYKQWSINTVTVFPNYKLTDVGRAGRGKRNTRDSASSRRGLAALGGDTLKYDDFQVIDRTESYRPYVFYQAMQFEPGELYTKRDQNISLNRLVTLGAFKFVKNEFTPVRDTNRNLLDVTYLLTPYTKKSFNGEFGGFTQNDSRGGVRASISWRNKNLFRGAEIFTVKLSGSFEAQYGGKSERPNAYNAGIETNLNIPRFIIPFLSIKPSGMYIPRTIISTAYNYSLRAGAYQINSLAVGYGYNWKEDVRKDHKLYPFNITYVNTNILDTTKNDNDFNFSNLIYNGIIFGPTYEYTFNTQLDGVQRTNNFYFNGLIDLSGNLVGIAQGAKPDDPKKIFNSNYAQYLKAQVDFRYYRNLTPKTVLAARALFGYGYSYGNSSRMPNVKQFFSGGSSSLRGFPSRLVGPGTFNELYLTGGGEQEFLEILGDVKTELNLEYRAKLYKFIEGGVFVDAGNIWLQRDNPDFPGGKFTSNFYKELAVDAGLGIRFDFSILLLRFDFAFPIRKPWFPEGDRWKLNDIRFGDPQWRKENLFFNLAIGYPF